MEGGDGLLGLLGWLGWLGWLGRLGRLGGSAARQLGSSAARQNNRSGSGIESEPERALQNGNQLDRASELRRHGSSLRANAHTHTDRHDRTGIGFRHASRRRRRTTGAPLSRPACRADRQRLPLSAHTVRASALETNRQAARPAGEQASPRPRPPDRRPRRARPYRGASRAGRTLRHVNPPTGTASATRARRRPHRSDGACAPRVRARAAPDRVCPHRRNGRSR